MSTSELGVADRTPLARLFLSSLILWCVGLYAACGGDDARTDDVADAISDSSDDAHEPDDVADAISDSSDDAHEPDDDEPDTDVPQAPVCTGFFGDPNESTGLPEGMCVAECACGDGTWFAPQYTAEEIAALRSTTLIDAPSAPRESPYLLEEPPSERSEGVCALVVDDHEARTYRLREYSGEREAHDAGAQVTHSGGCGLCSSLVDLAVYLETPNLAAPVRECGLIAIRESEEASIDCLRDLGFSEPCAMIWYYNTRNTRDACLGPCVSLLNAPFHEPDGSLNACIQCDEDISGPTFKGVAGRTRRNSGIPTALCRPCDEVTHLTHDYFVEATLD